jgi:hypothetical protein
MAVLSISLTLTAGEMSQWLAAATNLLRPLTVPLNAIPPLDPGLPPVPSELTITGLDLPLATGLACTRLESLDNVAPLYALLKYARVFSAGTPGVTLATDIQALDTHKKRVLSDEVGCGMALLTSASLEPGLLFIDTETAIALDLLRTKQTRSRRPDYFAVDPAVPTVAYAIEAKGSQQGSSYSMSRQIPRGCAQVAAVDLSTTPPLTAFVRLVIATALESEVWGSASTVFLGDLPEIDAVPYAFETRWPNAAVLHYLKVARLMGDVEFEASLIRHGVVGRHAARHLTPEAREEAPEARVTPWEGEQVQVGRDIYEGSRIRLVGPQAQIDFFFGLLRDVREPLLRGDLSQAAAHRRKPTVVPSDPVNQLIAARADGSLLSLRIVRS